MDGLRQYFVIFFLALFVVGTTAGVAISHCGSARQMDAIDSTVSTSKSCESGDHAGATEDHQKKSETGSSGSAPMPSRNVFNSAASPLFAGV